MPKRSGDAERERQAIARGDMEALGLPRDPKVKKLLARFEPNRTLTALQFAVTELIAMVASTGRTDVEISERTQRTVSHLVEHRACDTYTPPRVRRSDVKRAFTELSRVGRNLRVLDDEEMDDRFGFK